MTFLYEYMTVEERAEAIEEAQFMNESMKLDHELEKLQMEHAIRLSDIDTECLVKEYTQEDLENMYMAEMAIYMEGVKDWWENFKKWVSNLINKITGNKPEKPSNPEGDVTLPCDPKEVENILDKTKNVVSNITNFQKEDGSLDEGKVLKGIGIAAATGSLATAVAAAVNKPFRTTLGKAFESVTNLIPKFNSVKSSIDSQNPGTDEASQKKCKGIKELFSKVFSPLTNAFNKLRGKTSGSSPDNAEKSPDESGNHKETEKGEQEPEKGKHEGSEITPESGKPGKHEEGRGRRESGEVVEDDGQTPGKHEEGRGKRESGETDDADPNYKGKHEEKSNSPTSTDLINEMKKDKEREDGWKLLEQMRPRTGKKKTVDPKYKKMADLAILEDLFSKIPGNNPNRLKARKCINWLRDNGLKDVKESVSLLMEMFDEWDRMNEVIMESDDIGSSIIDSMEDPFNFMESGLDVTGGLKDLMNLMDQL